MVPFNLLFLNLKVKKNLFNKFMNLNLTNMCAYEVKSKTIKRNGGEKKSVCMNEGSKIGNGEWWVGLKDSAAHYTTQYTSSNNHKFFFNASLSICPLSFNPHSCHFSSLYFFFIILFLPFY